jgi:hypothetical protein
MRAVTWSFAIYLAFAPLSIAQSISGPLPLQTTSGTGFTSAPYSAKETTVKVQTLTDGTTATETFVELVWRDAEGRTRREMIRHTDAGAEYRSVIITDPVGGIYLKWTVGNESAGRVTHIWPTMPAQRRTAPPPSGLQEPQGAVSPGPTPNFQRETLPAQEINGIYSEGTRTIRTIHLNEASRNRVIQVMNELWLSPELKIIVRHIHDDPRTGRSTTNVTDVVRGDPDSGLFEPPEGYVLRYEVADHGAKGGQ